MTWRCASLCSLTSVSSLASRFHGVAGLVHILGRAANVFCDTSSAAFAPSPSPRSHAPRSRPPSLSSSSLPRAQCSDSIHSASMLCSPRSLCPSVAEESRSASLRIHMPQVCVVSCSPPLARAVLAILIAHGLDSTASRCRRLSTSSTACTFSLSPLPSPSPHPRYYSERSLHQSRSLSGGIHTFHSCSPKPSTLQASSAPSHPHSASFNRQHAQAHRTPRRPVMEVAYAQLKRYWGFPSFRGVQAEVRSSSHSSSLIFQRYSTRPSPAGHPEARRRESKCSLHHADGRRKESRLSSPGTCQSRSTALFLELADPVRFDSASTASHSLSLLSSPCRKTRSTT